MKQNGDGSPPEKDFVVLGAQLAAAAAAQRRHEAEHGQQSSPLRDVKYAEEAVWLWRWVDAPQDAAVYAAVSHYRSLDESSRAAMRANLSMDDFYTIWTFARRCCLAAMRTRDTGKVETAFNALAMIELARMDWRDVHTVSCLARHTGQHLGADVVRIAQHAAGLAEPTVAAALAEQAHEPIDDLAGACGQRVVDTPEGIAFFDDDCERFAPESDLITRAFRAAQMLEADSYCVRGVTVACELWRGWLGVSEDDPAFAKIARRLRGCVLIGARPRIEPPPEYEGQFLNLYLAEAGKEASARAIAEAAGGRAVPHVAKLGVASRRLCAVVVAKSMMYGVPPQEEPHSLERFRERLEALLA
jgi:hypothetical protein